MANQWFSIVEYAREFNISDMTIRRRIKTGKLNAVLKDGKYYIPVTQAEASKLKHSSNQNHMDDEYNFDDEEQNFSTQHKQGSTQSPKTHSLNSSLQHSYKRPTSNIQTSEASSHAASKHASRSQMVVQKPSRNSINHTSSIETSNFTSTPVYRNHSELPSPLLDSLSLYEKSLVDTQNLLQFCESSLQLMQKMEIKLQEQFEQKVENLQLEIQNKNQEIIQLQQQLEDFQVLVKILEKKNS